MEARHLFAATLLGALALPLSSCRIVNGKPDVSGFADIFTAAKDDTVYIEAKPTGAVAVSSRLPNAPTAIPQPQAALPAKPLAAAAPKPQPAAAPVRVAPGGPYTVQAGDSLSRIARAHGVGTAALAAANGLNPQSAVIRPGQQLRIPQGGSSPVAAVKPAAAKSATAPAAAPKLATAPAPKPATAAAKAGQHSLRAGETLAAVSRQYGVSLQELMRVNAITDESARTLRPGTLLTIPTKKP